MSPRTIAVLAALLSPVALLELSHRVDATGLTVTVGAATGSPGGSTSFPVTFQAPSGSTTIGLQTDIAFDSSHTPITAVSGLPSCTPSVAMGSLHKTLSFAFLPAGCAGTACTAVRALVVNTDNSAIPDGATLFTCEVEVDPSSSPGIYSLTTETTAGADSRGLQQIVTGIDGQVTVTTIGCG